MARDSDKAPVYTENQDILRRVDSRLGALRINYPESSEIARHEMIREDIMGKMSDEEKEGYIKLTTKVLSPAEQKAAAAALQKAMDENRDKPSI